MKHYNRQLAVDYALKWALGRNPRYYDFDSLGGDCTNFVSQCVYAGAGIMNYSVNGWYYINLNSRSPSWTGVNFLNEFIISNKGAAVYGRHCAVNELMPADIIQLSRKGRWTHSLFVSGVNYQPFQIYVCTHTYDSRNNPLSAYWYDDIRYIHIQGVR